MTPNDRRELVPKRYLGQVKKRIYEHEYSSIFELKDGKVLKLRMYYTKEKSKQLIAKLKRLGRHKWMPQIYAIGYKGDIFWYVIDKFKSVSNKIKHLIDDYHYKYHYKNDDKRFWKSKSGIKLSLILSAIHNYSYSDIHGGNIMIDNKGNFKVIDLESFQPGGQLWMS